MSPQQWHRFKNIVVAVKERDRREWPSHLFAECGDDVDLFFEASSLLAVSNSVGDFIERPAWRLVSHPAEVGPLTSGQDIPQNGDLISANP